MKKASILFLPLLFAMTTFSQQTTQKQTIAKTDYLQKSKEQKATAWILLGGGFLTSAIATVSNAGVCIGSGCTKKSFPVVPVAIGGAAMVTSIPFFIVSGRNKRKAMNASVFIDTEQRPVLQGAAISNQSFPVLAIKLNF